jgi:hypothetical protein
MGWGRRPAEVAWAMAVRSRSVQLSFVLRDWQAHFYD